MTQYSNPDLTQREIVENSILAVDAMLEQVDVAIAAANGHLDNAVDFQTVQFIGQHVNMLNSTKYQLNAELTRLKNIVAVWNGEDPQPVNGTYTPTLPTTPLS